MIVYHGFEMSPAAFHDLKARPLPGGWRGEYASQSPLNAHYVTRGGGGAEGTAGYLALPGSHADQFYAEATPQWYASPQALDLRDTRVSLWLKAVTPIRVAPGYRPHLFIDDFDDPNHSYCGWYVTEPLRVGVDWLLNDVDLRNDPSLWTRYSENREIDTVLARVGFIGVMYLNGTAFRGVDACGILGIDELRYGMPLE